MPSYCLATRAQALTMRILGLSNSEITKQTGIPERSVQRLAVKAKECGFDPAICTVLKDEYLTDDPRSRRPLILSEEQQTAVIDNLRSSHTERDKPRLKFT